MADSTIGNKVWRVAGVLQDAGVSYSDYLEQITFLLFLKMAHENAQLPDNFRWKGVELPDDCKWETIVAKNGEELKDHYSKVLATLAKQGGMIGEIYREAQNKITQPMHIRKVVDMLKDINWSSLSEDVKGDIYEDLLERVAQDTKSGAGQYFTPRSVIKTIVKCVNPQKGKTVADPCCGSGGFLLSTKTYIEQQGEKLTGKEKEFLKLKTFSGTEIVASTYRLCLMNLLLHGIGEFGGTPPIKCQDSLAFQPSGEDLCDYVLTNPPFGTKSSTRIEVTVKDKKTGEEVTKTKIEKENYVRSDFISVTSNKQLNFVQHIKSMLKVGGTAAVVLPDNVLFEAGEGERIRKELLSSCDLHTILRLPTGIFYKPGVKTNVIFFERRPPSKDVKATREVWIYDYRTNVKHTPKQNPLTEKHLNDFVKCYNSQDRYHRQETYNPDTNPQGRWRRFGIDEILQRENTSLDITWIKQDDGEDEDKPLSELLDGMQEKSDRIASSVAELQKLKEGIASIDE